MSAKESFFSNIKGSLNFEAGKDTGTVIATISEGHYLEQAEKSNIVPDVLAAVKKHEKNPEHNLAHDVIKSVEKYNKAYLGDMTEFAAGQVKAVMSKDKKIERAVVKTDWGTARGSSVAVTIDREREFRDPKTKETTTKPYIRAVVTDKSVKVSKSLMKAQAEILKEAL